MTLEQRAELLAAQARLEGNMNTGMAAMSGKIDTLTAQLDAHLRKTTDETKALFAGRREHAQKIEGIRVDYVPRSDFGTHKKENREEHEAMMRTINCVRWSVAKLAGGITLIAFLAGLAIKWIGV
jgi:hypothetical protein